MGAETGCTGILADLAQEYEKSRALLEELECSLKERVLIPEVVARVQGSALPDRINSEARKEGDEETDDEEGEEEALGSSNKDSPPPGLRLKLSRLFWRTCSLPTRGMDSGKGEEITPRISVVNLNGPVSVPPEESRRSVSFHPSSSCAALQPTSVLSRQHSRASLEVRQPQQLETMDSVELRRVSSSNLGGLPMAIRKRGIDPYSASGRRNSLEMSSSKNRTTVQCSPDNSTAIRPSHGQLALQVSSPFSIATPINIFSPWQQQQQQLQQAETSPNRSQQPPIRGDSMPRRSMSRRASDQASTHDIPSRRTSFSVVHAQQHAYQQSQHSPSQPQLGSPVGSPIPGCLSPGASLSAGLPALFPSPTPSSPSSRSLMRNSPNGLFSPGGNMRPHSMSSVATSAGAAEDQVAAGLGIAPPGIDRSVVSATALAYPATMVAAAMAAAATIPLGSSSQLQLPLVPSRGRSMRVSMGPGCGSPTGAAAGGLEPRRLQPYRIACDGRESGCSAGPQEQHAGQERYGPAAVGKEVTAEAATAAAAGTPFGGTMHFI